MKHPIIVSMFLCVSFLMGFGTGSAKVLTEYGDLLVNGDYWLDAVGEERDLTRCDLVVRCVADLSEYIPAMRRTAWTKIGLGDGAWGWMSCGAPEAAVSFPFVYEPDDKFYLAATVRDNESNYNALDPDTLVPPPLGNPWVNYGINFDRDGIDPFHATMWGYASGVTYNTGGVYGLEITYHAISDTQGTMFARVNGAGTGFYKALKNAPPDFYPVGRSFSGDMTNLRLFASVEGTGVKLLSISVEGCSFWEEVRIDIKPGSVENPVNSGSRGVVPVAVFSSASLDATSIDPANVQLAGAGVAKRGKAQRPLVSVEDVDQDGLQDVVLKFETRELDPEQMQDGIAVLSGITTDGTPIIGQDSISIIKSK